MNCAFGSICIHERTISEFQQLNIGWAIVSPAYMVSSLSMAFFVCGTTTTLTKCMAVRNSVALYSQNEDRLVSLPSSQKVTI
mmetsp:Transcript_3734/g.9778  ORF Transcript_3734/g.9778 Transcript_3734/m.9778 type:complete len:82 (-) Transcript_3734:70-315(-)